ncbi:coniferyl aldehyde dehydrogenase [Pseudoalteromonas sp. SWXJZ94C]|uniref:coniferyl aldehyde dehydrogenase n=1 Tax=unclassified Pseudoalteromonas TaxID=194690 RepID=UPI00041DD3E6|nr:MULTISPECIES: coniferyl aldehyde dehydrogenase [unclassified Pseudoalteromonas]MBH0056779.1 coniferyl aldehyde dehydrogenase [Pseudoalteromonas sp. SWXJZ94C]
MTTDTSHTASLITQFDELQNSFLATPYLSIKERIAVLKKLRARVVDLEEELVAAASKDFGYRTAFDTLLGDILPTVQGIAHIIKKLPKWSKPSNRSVGLSLWPSKVSVTYQPKGVVGVIAPWNYPIQLAIVPVITAIAAGNRVMLKLSEFTPHTNIVLEKLFNDEMQEHCKVIQGGSDVAAEFSSLPFAHLLFTGSTGVGKLVMASASRNLTPVTLELGGKSPVIITEQADIAKAAEALLFGKMANAGQICVAPDYVFVPKALEHQLIQQLCDLYKKHFKDGVEGKNLTSIISDSHYQRLTGYLAQAEQLGASIVKPLDHNQQDADKHRLGLHIVTHVTDEMQLMQDELFGPILPIMSYDKLDDAVDYIKRHHHPLALYILGQDKHAQEYIIKQTLSGTVAVNDTLVQVTADDAPFGGVGHSGMGNYHGREGFLTFSHAKNTLVSGSFNPRIGMLLKQSKVLIKLLKWLYIR